jgi:hypothetical protein
VGFLLARARACLYGRKGKVSDGSVDRWRDDGLCVLAAFATVSADADDVKLVLSQTSTVIRRVIDSNGKPWAKQRLRIELANGPYLSSSAHFAVSAVMTDEQGRFVYKDGPVGSTGEISAFHQKINI